MLVAIRENEQRARFIGYPTNRYKLIGFVLSAVVVGARWRHCPSSTIASHRPSRCRSRSRASCIAMVVIGGMRSFLGPGARRVVLHPVPRVPVDLDPALAVLFRPAVRRLHRVLADRPRRRRRAVDRAVPQAVIERPAMAGRRTCWRAALPQIFAVRTASAKGRCWWRATSASSFGGIHAVDGVVFDGAGPHTARPDRPEWRRQDHGLQPRCPAFIRPKRNNRARRPLDRGTKPEDITAAGVGRSFQITSTLT